MMESFLAVMHTVKFEVLSW